MQEIYNRFFFYREDEVRKLEDSNKERQPFTQRLNHESKNRDGSLTRNIANFEDLKSRDSLKMFSKDSLVSSPLDLHSHSQLEEIKHPTQRSLYTIRVNSSDHMASQQRSIVSKSLQLDKSSVQEIMASCANQIGPSGYDTLANQHLKQFNKVQEKNDQAMARLIQLYTEYCDQLQIVDVPVNAEKARSSQLRKFLRTLNRKPKPKKTQFMFENLEKPEIDQKSIDVIMREELH